MAPTWAKKDLKRLQAALRVLREEDADWFNEIAADHSAAIVALFLEPRHAIQQRSAAELSDDVHDAVAELMEDQ